MKYTCYLIGCLVGLATAKKQIALPSKKPDALRSEEPSSTTTTVACGITRKWKYKTNPKARVTGGSVAEPGNWPWQVGLRQKANPQRNIEAYTFCGGIIIDSRTVLTAAHCMDCPRTPYHVWNEDVRRSWCQY